MALSLRLRRASPRNPRLFWLGQLRRWHWISGALSMGGLLLFAVTGFTLNHAAQIEARPVVTTREAVLPVVVEEQGLRATLSFVITTAGANGIHVAPVVFCLRVYSWITVYFAGGSYQNAGVFHPGEAQQIVRT